MAVALQGTDASGRGPGWTRAVSVQLWLPALTVLLAVCWLAVYVGGGTETALPHVFYVPIVAAAMPFGRRGSLVVAVAAGLLCGPLMPLDVANNTAQELINWGTRAGFFLAVGLIAGTTVDAQQRSLRASVTARLEDELAQVDGPSGPLDPEVGLRIRATLEARDFHPVFQPVYSLSDGRLVAVEALTRFHAEPHQPPDVWFEQADRVGMGRVLELAAIEAALEGARALPAEVALHVNAGPATLCDPALLQLLDAHSARHVVVEITEHDVIEDYRQFDVARQRLREHGAHLAIDDAGAGFASLRHIVRLAPEIIKLDMSLSRNVRHDPVLAALAEALIHFAERTGSQLIVEGIEEPADLHTWQRLGAQAAQGYLLAYPGPLPVPTTCGAISGPSWGVHG